MFALSRNGQVAKLPRQCLASRTVLKFMSMGITAHQVDDDHIENRFSVPVDYGLLLLQLKNVCPVCNVSVI